jgi:tetratricopeptide (TPR) repeat protein
VLNSKRLMSWLLILCAASVAHAQDDKATARAHYQKGLAAYALGHFAEAASEYEAAFALVADSAILYNAAQAHRAAGDKRRALELYQSYLRVFGSDIRNRDEVQRHINALKQAIASEESAQRSPPVEPIKIAPHPVVEAAPPHEDPPPPKADVVAATAVVARTPEKSRKWIWGVVAGSVVVAGLAIGLGVGLAPAANPTPTFGDFRAH